MSLLHPSPVHSSYGLILVQFWTMQELLAKSLTRGLVDLRLPDFVFPVDNPGVGNLERLSAVSAALVQAVYVMLEEGAAPFVWRPLMRYARVCRVLGGPGVYLPGCPV